MGSAIIAVLYYTCGNDIQIIQMLYRRNYCFIVQPEILFLNSYFLINIGNKMPDSDEPGANNNSKIYINLP